jgi:uncharacterized membrane protein
MGINKKRTAELFVKKYVMTGLVMLLPLALTVWIIASIVGWLTGPFIGLAEKILSALGLTGVPLLFLSAEQAIFLLSQLLVLLFLFAFIVAIGAIGRHIVVAYCIRAGDKLIHKIPVISSVYKTSQELIQTILATDNKAFKQVVLVPFPNPECWSIGLVTKEGPVAPELIPVFVPTTPNPTSGYLIMYERSKVVPLQMTVEEAFRYIISCGVLLTGSTMTPKKIEGEV